VGEPLLRKIWLFSSGGQPENVFDLVGGSVDFGLRNCGVVSCVRKRGLEVEERWLGRSACTSQAILSGLV